ncbi:hypothetical protein QVD17_26729 [Tagetes erecta]|uniref:Uncharacterized protein n=1 Tax=Tagetes erecta TaxID=13708 RepID=A0AAD8K7W7_TARER|nr:hypothetical protein QVD17_26729 [Tagetes erecta]
MEIKVKSTQFIKPSNPTPQRLRGFKLSRLDQLAPPTYVDMIFYYKTTGHEVHDRCSQLIKSLSEVLNFYYPLAGRITRDMLQVDCTDQGVKYLETQVGITLDDFLICGPKIEQVGQLICAPDIVTDALVTIQVNLFDCGSLVIGVSALHKVTDAYNLVRFINNWASMNRTGRSDAAYIPSFDNLATLFPPMEVSSLDHHPPNTLDAKPVILTKSYVFNGAAISNLRAKASSENSKHSRVTLVTALIWKALISIDQVKSGHGRDCLLAPAIMLRRKKGPPVSESSFGNVWVPYPIRFLDRTEPKFLDLVALVEVTTRNMMSWLSKASGEEICTQAKACYDEVDEELKQNKFSIITSWCRFGIYEADFGWGKPYWTSRSGSGTSHEMVTLMDDKDGNGIEAWVSLNEKVMHLFEQDQDIISSSS